MLKTLPLLIVALLSFGQVPAASPALAQTSFGKVSTATPDNREEWFAHLQRELKRALRRSDTALNTVARNAMRPQQVTITISREGRVLDVAVDGEPGKGAAMAAAYKRSFSNMRLPPFTPDMSDARIGFTLSLGVTRG